MGDNLHDVICWVISYLKGNHEWFAKCFCRFFTTALQVRGVVFHFVIYMSIYLNIITNIKLNNLGSARIRRLLVEVLRYMPEDRGFESRWFHWKFSLTYSFRPHYGPGVDSASNRTEYQEYFLGVIAAGA